MTTSGPPAARTARIAHLAVGGSALLTTLVLAGLRASGAVPVEPGVAISEALLRGGAILLLLGATIALRVFHATFPPVKPDAETWWTTNLGRAVAIWALADGGAVMGGAAYLLTGDTLVLALAVAWAAAMFVRYTPGRLTDG